MFFHSASVMTKWHWHEYVLNYVLTMYLINILLVTNFCARGDKDSFTIHLTNAKDLSISPHVVLILQPHSPVNSVWNNCDSLWSDSSPEGTNKMKESVITGFEE